MKHHVGSCTYDPDIKVEVKGVCKLKTKKVREVFIKAYIMRYYQAMLLNIIIYYVGSGFTKYTSFTVAGFFSFLIFKDMWKEILE